MVFADPLVFALGIAVEILSAVFWKIGTESPTLEVVFFLGNALSFGIIIVDIVDIVIIVITDPQDAQIDVFII